MREACNLRQKDLGLPSLNREYMESLLVGEISQVTPDKDQELSEQQTIPNLVWIRKTN
jgi:hypothetical protein